MNLVIGLGNPLSRDDSFGLLVLDRLARLEPDSLPATALSRADTDLLGRIDEFAAYNRVILVDAILDPDARLAHRGDVVPVDEEMFQSWPETSPSVHQFTPLLAVRLFRKLYPEAHTRIVLVAYCTDRIGLGARGGFELDEAAIDAGVKLVLSLLS